ncbi:MAG: NADH:ubiquinone reductase (Na(+)-transporting) subunit C, partial [Alloprevotella tannerae]|nr:NADH:ubiquinone reductase (Na(+)-transporting) subunit C [Alloprevotella tannerae]
MKLNTNSNVYTIVYSIVVVVIVAFLLAFCYSALKSRSEANERIDKKQQILAALNIRNVSKEQVEEKYKEVVVADEIITSQGNILKDGTQKDKDGFTVSRKDMSKDNLPIYIC